MRKTILNFTIIAFSAMIFTTLSLSAQAPDNPVITGDLVICQGSDAVLNATTNAEEVKWYNSATSTTPIHTGFEIVLDNLMENTSVWAQGVNPDSEGTNYTGGARLNPGGYTGGSAVSSPSSPWGLRFNISQDIVLNSVDVFILAETESVLIVQLKDSQYNILEQLTVNTPAGNNDDPLQYTVELGFEIPKGDNYSLVASVSPKMVRESAAYHDGFPYLLGDVGVVTQGMLQDTPGATNATTYYFFYNWDFTAFNQVTSDRVKADILVNEIPNPPAGEEQQRVAPGSTLADLNVQGTNLQWYADKNGLEPLEASTAVIDGASYYVSQTIAGCESEFLKVTVSISVNITENIQSSFSIYPNPVKDILFVSGNQSFDYEIFTITGRSVRKGTLQEDSIDVENLESGIYLIQISGDKGISTQRFVKQ